MDNKINNDFDTINVENIIDINSVEKIYDAVEFDLNFFKQLCDSKNIELNDLYILSCYHNNYIFLNYIYKKYKKYRIKIDTVKSVIFKSVADGNIEIIKYICRMEKKRLVNNDEYFIILISRCNDTNIIKWLYEHKFFDSDLLAEQICSMADNNNLREHNIIHLKKLMEIIESKIVNSKFAYFMLGESRTSSYSRQAIYVITLECIKQKNYEILKWCKTIYNDHEMKFGNFILFNMFNIKISGYYKNYYKNKYRKNIINETNFTWELIDIIKGTVTYKIVNKCFWNQCKYDKLDNVQKLYKLIPIKITEKKFYGCSNKIIDWLETLPKKNSC